MAWPYQRHIVSNFGIVEFRVPRWAPIKVSSDIDYVIYHIRYGAVADRLWLTMMFGPLVGGETPDQAPDSSVKWQTTKWSCGGTTAGWP